MFYNMISLNVKVPEDLEPGRSLQLSQEYGHTILQSLGHPISSQVPMNYLSYLAMSSFVLRLGHLTALADNNI